MKLRKKHAPETDKYHPENLFKLNGEGLTWEEYKQNERGVTAPKVLSSVLRWRSKSPLLFSGLVAVADVLYISTVFPDVKSFLSTHPLAIFGFMFLTVCLGFASYSAIFQLFCMTMGLSGSDKDNGEGATQDPSSSSVRGYIKDTGRKIEDFYSEVELLEARAQYYKDKGSRDMSASYRDMAWKMCLSLDDKRLPMLLGKHDLIFVPATVQRGTLELMAVTSENSAGRWDENPRFRGKKTGFKHSIEGAATYSATLDTTKLPETITEDTSKLCEFIAKPEVQETLTARMYAHQQASRVRGVADETLPDWTTSDSVLLDDYKRVKKWYINYRDTLTEKIYDLAQAHARDLRFETDRKTSRRDAISAALSF